MLPYHVWWVLQEGAVLPRVQRGTPHSNTDHHLVLFLSLVALSRTSSWCDPAMRAARRGADTQHHSGLLQEFFLCPASQFFFYSFPSADS